jgi:hypothetical protein
MIAGGCTKNMPQMLDEDLAKVYAQIRNNFLSKYRKCHLCFFKKYNKAKKQVISPQIG